MEPVGDDNAGLHAAAPGIEVGFDDDVGVNEIAQQAQNVLKSGLGFHVEQNAAGS